MKQKPNDASGFADFAVVPPARPSRPVQSGGLNLHDILSILWTHKWKILVLGLLGLGGASWIYFNRTPMYQSEAKLFIPYVLDTGSELQNGEKVTSAGGRGGAGVLNVEMDLVRSWDSLEQVAKDITPQVILPNANPETVSVTDGAFSLLSNLTVSVPKNSLIINVAYQHQDPEKARLILDSIVNTYLLKHRDTHRSGRSFEAVDKKAKDAETILNADRQTLQTLRTTHSILSVPGREAALTTQQSSIESELLTASARRAEQLVRVQSAEAAAGSSSSPGGAKKPEAVITNPTPMDLTQFRMLNQQVDGYRMKAEELKMKFTATNPQVRAMESRVADIERKRDTMIAKFPALGMVATANADGPSLPAALDPRVERETLAQIEARIAFLQNQKVELEKELGKLLTVGAEITQLERDIAERETNFRYYTTAKERASVSQSLQPTDLENISVIQKPSVSTRAPAGPETKIAAGLAVGGFALGIALAFLIELLLNRSIKSPQEIESKLQLPLMLSIPLFTPASRRLGNGGEGNSALQLGNAGEDGESGQPHNDLKPATAWRRSHFIRPFADAIRDRIGYQFHVNGVTHKPKIIGLTGFSEGAGTSTLAASLAASFAEMTDGKVLYINLNGGVPLPSRIGEGEPRPGDPGTDATGFNKDAIRVVDRIDNLAVATISAGSEKPEGRRNGGGNTSQQGKRSFISKQLYQMMPRLRESEYDYVIFDLPALSPTSPTFALAGFMDKVLLVVDAGNNDRGTIRRAYRDLTSDPNADVSTILNKTRQSLPAWLQG